MFETEGAQKARLRVYEASAVLKICGVDLSAMGSSTHAGRKITVTLSDGQEEHSAKITADLSAQLDTVSVHSVRAVHLLFGRPGTQMT